jgi:hypothetical protein
MFMECLHSNDTNVAVRLFQLTVPPYRNTFSNIIRTKPTQSAMTDVSLGDGRPMFSSRANLTAAMIEAEMASVDANRSVIRRFASYSFARFISPIGRIIGE